VKARPYDVAEDPSTKNITVRYEDLETGKPRKEEVELLVLSIGLLPNDRNERLAKVLKIRLDKLGYFKEKDPLMAPLDTDVEGNYLCGGATGAIDISESAVQATAVRGRSFSHPATFARERKRLSPSEEIPFVAFSLSPNS
jgi:heterodisulfide reductase subunit A